MLGAMLRSRATVALLLLPLAGCPSDDASTGASTSLTATGSIAPGTDESTTSTSAPTTAADDSTGDAAPPQLEIQTTAGTFVIELDPALAPLTTANLLAYVEAGFYDGSDGLAPTTIHRAVPAYVIQGGGLGEDLEPKGTMAPITNEAGNGLSNVRGAVGMARVPDDPDSATSQFFVNLVDNPDLDTPPGFAVFGRVVEGMEVVDAIATVPTTDVPPHEDVPVDPIVILSTAVR